ncbi:uncharacterized protein LOC141629739 [Silene latifolia]|uniref:uncharacterized protein LOC141629739 n=1 Tax=Silene latifolia TaxID=37657 RepID=UPI003D78738E
MLEPSREVLLINEAEMLQELKGYDNVYALVAKDVVFGQNVSLPKEVQELLQSYEDVLPNELPSGLPPLRGIEHQIDFIPGATLPNKAAYISDPKATQELQQIGELVSKGFVRESLSSRVVPALLVPKKDGSWRMCTDSRAINNITIKYRFPIPRLYDILDELSGAQLFSKINLRRFIKDFSTLMAPITECVKKGELKWGDKAESSFNIIKEKLCESAILTLPNFNKLFEVEYAKWVEFLQSFNFSRKYIEGKDNIVADALSRRFIMLSFMEQRVLGFEYLKELYVEDPDFKEEWELLQYGQIKLKSKYLVQNGFLFFGNKLCVPRGPYRNVLIREVHSCGLARHFGIQKTYDILQEQLY